jgi:transmembrane E3 ubiquitin-protein ligase
MDSLLETFRVQGRKLNPAQESYFPNVTGFIHGNLHFRNISLPALATPSNVSDKPLLETYMADFNTTEMVERLGKWNWTTSGKVAFSVREKPATTIQQSVDSSADLALIHVCEISLCSVTPE